jgi:hypothetical protein
MFLPNPETLTTRITVIRRQRQPSRAGLSAWLLPQSNTRRKKWKECVRGGANVRGDSPGNLLV